MIGHVQREVRSALFPIVARPASGVTRSRLHLQPDVTLKCHQSTAQPPSLAFSTSSPACAGRTLSAFRGLPADPPLSDMESVVLGGDRGAANARRSADRPKPRHPRRSTRWRRSRSSIASDRPRRLRQAGQLPGKAGRPLVGPSSSAAARLTYPYLGDASAWLRNNRPMT